jgi:signal transduction histidine kinase
MLSHTATPIRPPALPLRRARDKTPLAGLVVEALGCAVAAFEAGSARLVFANASFEAAFGALTAAPITRHDFERQFRGDDADAAGAEGPAPAFEDGDRLHRPSGHWFHIRRSEAGFGADALVVLELSDISQRLADEQRKRGEHQQLLFTSKVMSVGEMAATLAHELNQPIGSLLNFLNGCVLRLDRGTPPRDELRAALVEARQQCERAAAIITRIREFVRTREPKMSEVAIGALFATVGTLLESEIRLHRVELTLDVPATLPLVLADRVMLEQVAHNLTKNAIEAMRTQAGPRRLCLGARLGDDGLVEATVRDSGPGVAEAARGQLFSPFFTTKADGLGIGLNICRSMMEFHGGSLYYRQPSDGGSCFCFSLPGIAPTGDAR